MTLVACLMKGLQSNERETRLPRLTLRRLIAGAISGMLLALMPSFASAADACQDACEQRYYQCNVGSGWAAERTCAEHRRTCSAACPAQKHAAIAYSRETRGFGSSTELPTRQAAEAKAIAECAATASSPTDCKVVVWFYNRCGTLVLGDPTAYGWAHNLQPAVSTKEAMDRCKEFGGENCRVVRDFCSR